jgi:hypothetical protein
VTHRRQIEAFEDVQHLEGDKALRAGRHLDDLAAAIRRAQGLDPVGRVLGEVSQSEQAAARRDVGDDGFGDRTVVEGVSSLVLNELEAASQPRVPENLAVARWPSMLQERRRRRFVCRQPFEAAGKLVGHQLGGWKALVCVKSRGRDRPSHRVGAKPRQQLVPAVDDPRDIDGQRPVARHLREAASPVFLRRGRER